MSTRFVVLAASLFAALVSLSCSSTTQTASTNHSSPRGIEPARGSEDDPEERDRSYWEQRAYPTDRIPVEVYRAAIARELEAGRMRAASDTGWSELGPAPIINITYGFDSAQNTSGRALSLAIHPNDHKTLILGTAQGGIWKSTDRGANWRSVAETTLPSLAINIVRYSPANPSVVYAGTGEPNGSTSYHGFGLLRSTDGGETWQQLPAAGNGWNFEYAAVSGLEFDARDPNTLYITTATIALNFFRVPNQPPTGLFKSTDGGQSWTLLRAAQRHVLSGAASTSAGFMDLEYGGAKAPDLFYVSEFLGGLLKSEDGGQTWAYITPRKPTGLGAFPADVPHVNWFDGSVREFRLLNRLPLPDAAPDYRRIEIGMSPANPRILYAGLGAQSARYDRDNNGIYEQAKDITLSTGMLFKSEDGGASWRWLGTLKDGIPDYCTSQCSYDNVITVSDTNPNDVLIGGSANYSQFVADPFDRPVRLVEMPWRGMIYRTLDGGKTWTDLTPHCTRVGDSPDREMDGMPIFKCAEVDPTKVIHPDIHDIVYSPDGSIYVANDGGVYRGTNAAQQQPPAVRGGKRRSVGAGTWAPLAGLTYTWDNLNDDLSTLQLYKVASHPTNPNIILGCTQDNSCGYWDGSKWEGWGAGDGTTAIFDPRDPNYVYLGYQFVVNRHDNGGTKEFSEEAGWKYEVFSRDNLVWPENVAFVPVFTLDPTEPTIAYGASDRALYRSTNRGEGAKRLAPGQNTEGVPTAVSVSPRDSRNVWLGTSTGRVYKYRINTDGTAAVSKVNIGMPERVISSVQASHADADTVFVTFNGYDANTPATPGHVFVSRDSGKTWSNISSNLPDVPVTAMALHPFDPNRMWVSTDIAVYSTTDGGTTWTSERRNMPVVAVADLHYNHNTGYLVIGTHGRGVWRMKVSGATN